MSVVVLNVISTHHLAGVNMLLDGIRASINVSPWRDVSDVEHQSFQYK